VIAVSVAGRRATGPIFGTFGRIFGSRTRRPPHAVADPRATYDAIGQPRRASWARRSIMRPTRIVGRPADGPPFYTYEQAPGTPAITVERFTGAASGEIDEAHRHAHDFVVLAYFDRGGGDLQLAGTTWRIEDGDVFLVAPHEVIGAADDLPGLAQATAWIAYFPADVIGQHAVGALLSWRTHPLLFPFVRGTPGGAHRLRVSVADRANWSNRFTALARELHTRDDGYEHAALAHLTLLLIAVGRLTSDAVTDLRVADEPLIAEAFAYIEDHWCQRVSLRDVAAAVNVSPGHLTTVVRRKTGRTVHGWLTERRMAEARTLLSQTDLTIEQISRRVGYAEAGHFARTFRQRHDASPTAWRRTSTSTRRGL
jgi:AraC family transcriptional activator of pobA